jgi:uncharacterized protein
MTQLVNERLELLVIQPTPFCNLDCDYCYLPHRSSTARISNEVLRHTFEKVLSSGHVQGPFTVVWHAGEPLALPIEFYENALRLIDEVNQRGVSIQHSFQTNGTLIDKAWCDFIDHHAIRIGVSVDGPAFLHDAHRKTRAGRGTHSRVMRGIQSLQQHRIDFHVITVLTAETLDYPDELFRFYLEHGICRIGFNFEEIEGIHKSSTLDSAEAAGKARAFLRRFLELVKGSEGKLTVREFTGMERFVLGSSEFASRNQENTPMRIVSVDCHGNVSTFSPELLGLASDRYGDFHLGNVLRDDIDAMKSTTKLQRIQADIEEGIARCRESCSYFAVCGGGSPSNKYFENLSFASTETMHCRLSKQVLADVVLETFETAALSLSALL